MSTPKPFGDRIDRRSLILGLGGSLALAGTGARWQVVSGQQPAQPGIAVGDCEDEPAVAMYLAWTEGKWVFQRAGDEMPKSDWQMFEHPTEFLSFLIPPRWTAIVGWADSFTRDGVPEFQDRPIEIPQLTLTRILSPHEDAAFEIASGNINAYPVPPLEAARIAQQGIAGAKPTLRSICTHENPDNVTGPSWFTADRHKTNLLITMGIALPLWNYSAPSTALGYNTLYGPRRDMEELLHDAFLPMMRQFLKKPGGGADPTPTSTAEV